MRKSIRAEFSYQAVKESQKCQCYLPEVNLGSTGLLGSTEWKTSISSSEVSFFTATLIYMKKEIPGSESQGASLYSDTEMFQSSLGLQASHPSHSQSAQVSLTTADPSLNVLPIPV